MWRKRWGDRGVSRKLNNARLAQALAMGMASGLPLEEAAALSAGLLEALVSRVEPALVLVCSLLVGLILLSVMLPLMNIMATIG